MKMMMKTRMAILAMTAPASGSRNLFSSPKPSAAMTVPGAPNISNLRQWLKADRAFAVDVAWAKRMRDDRMMDAVLELGGGATRAPAVRTAARWAQAAGIGLRRQGQGHGQDGRGSGGREA